jgi:DNA-binding transcriptional ArsR family regulator
MVNIANMAEVGALMGDPARANMLSALMDGRALTAGELAACACVAPQTASGHLSRLAEAGLIAVERQGRHRYHRLASPRVAELIELMMLVAAEGAPAPRRPVRTGPNDAVMKRARTCYDHLAGEIAVAVAESMTHAGQIELEADAGRLTEAGAALMETLGVELAPTSSRRPFCRACLDWSERRPHIAGALGAALARRTFDLGWVRRIEGTRALHVTSAGETGFSRVFGVAV